MASQPHSGSAAAPRKIPGKALAVAVVLLLLVALALIFLLTGENGDQRTIEDRAGANQGPPATTRSSEGTLEAGGTALLPIPQGALRGLSGKSVTGKDVPVQNNSPEGGFWAGNSDAQRVYVAFDGQSPQTGRRVDLEGKVKAVPDQPQKTLGISFDDAQQLKDQGGYVEATSVKTVGKPIGVVPKGPED